MYCLTYTKELFPEVLSQWLCDQSHVRNVERGCGIHSAKFFLVPMILNNICIYAQEEPIKSQRKCFKKSLVLKISQAHWGHQLKLPASPKEHRASSFPPHHPPIRSVLTHFEAGRRYNSWGCVEEGSNEKRNQPWPSIFLESSSRLKKKRNLMLNQVGLLFNILK